MKELHRVCESSAVTFRAKAQQTSQVEPAVHWLSALSTFIFCESTELLEEEDEGMIVSVLLQLNDLLDTARIPCDRLRGCGSSGSGRRREQQ